MNVQQRKECGLEGLRTMRHFASNPKQYVCYICKKSVDYDYMFIGDSLCVVSQKRGFNGVDRPICDRCFRFSSFLDSVVTRICILLLRRR